MIQNLISRYPAVAAALDKLATHRVLPRIWARDHTLWKPDPTEITNRLGWLDIAERMRDELPGIRALVEAVQADGYTHALLLGMGGSSLAPEVFARTFGVAPGALTLAVLDSTDPGAVLAWAESLPLDKTLLLVSTKSGGTVETLSFFKFFYNRVLQVVGPEKVGAHFVAITDPGSSLAALAAEYRFRATLLNDPNIGGRYSALSFFGLLPAALLGIDLDTLLDRAVAAARQNAGDGLGVAAEVGAAIGALALEGRDKLTFFISPPVAGLGDWIEQLVAESTGKEGKGILPVVGEAIASPDAYGPDRLFVYLRLSGDTTFDAGVSALEEAGHPVLRLALNDLYDLGAQFFVWELATAVAGHFLQINPFDQPNVESAKVLARKMVKTYVETGVLPQGEAVAPDAGALRRFLAQARPGDYIALQAYIQPTTQADIVLNALRLYLRDRFKLATTVGYGPRFLHSTGQLHKGDRGNGLFIQFTADPLRDAAIPDVAGQNASAISFGVLEMAQALGDYQALVEAGRRVLRIHLGTDAVGGVRQLLAGLG